MNAIFSRFTAAFFALIGLLASPLQAFAADQINLAGKNTWDLYVYGNGEAIAQILTAVKLMLAPDHGGGAFRYLLLFLAIVGFVVLAVRAGFDPGKNFLKMFGFIFLVWAVMYGTQGARANVHIYDRYSNYSNVITGVPAIVALPASIVSQTGEWLTRQIETNFSIPGSFKMSESGGFNLFGKVTNDLNEFVISDPDLKRSLSAYVSDCVVPAIALSRMSTREIVTDTNLIDTLAKAQSQAIMTRYFPMKEGGRCEWMDQLGSGYNAQIGALMTCSAAYSCLTGDLELFAESLMQAKNEQWKAAGIMVPFEQAMSEALAHAGASGSGNPLARYSRPQGIILQKALTASMTGAFRSAAVRTGNNEIMTATAIAQAEQSQKSAWWTAAEIFENMMGYVYLVLQGFIFAIVPVVIIGLMIPGLGGKIFTNYFQILVWLMLWTPMLAIVNYLITIFGGAQMRETLAVAGLSMENSAILTEQANNLVIAAQFIGTMVPLITWGLVKGAMAFTEFVSHGIGSSFATQAGAQAATGNVSMGNLSMDNIGMNKYSTTMTSAVGMQSVQADFGAGKVLGKLDAGGTQLSGAGQNETASVTRTDRMTVTDSRGNSVTMSTEQALAMTSERRRNLSIAEDFVQKASELLSQSMNQSTAEGVSKSWSESDRTSVAEAASRAAEAVRNFATKVEGGIGISGFKFGADIRATKNKAEKALQDWKEAIERANSRSEDAKVSQDVSRSRGTQSSSGSDASYRKALEQAASNTQQASESIRRGEQYMSSLQFNREVGVTQSHTEGVSASGWTAARPVNVDPQIEAGRERLEEQARAFTQRTNGASEENVAHMRTGVTREQGQAGTEIRADAEALQRPAALDPDFEMSVSDTRVRLSGAWGSADIHAKAAVSEARQKIDAEAIPNPLKSPIK